MPAPLWYDTIDSLQAQQELANCIFRFRFGEWFSHGPTKHAEHFVWAATVRDNVVWRFYPELEDENIRMFSALSNKIGGWMVWDDGADDLVYIPLERWQACYAQWREGYLEALNSNDAQTAQGIG